MLLRISLCTLTLLVAGVSSSCDRECKSSSFNNRDEWRRCLIERVQACREEVSMSKCQTLMCTHCSVVNLFKRAEYQVKIKKRPMAIQRSRQCRRMVMDPREFIPSLLCVQNAPCRSRSSSGGRRKLGGIDEPNDYFQRCCNDVVEITSGCYKYCYYERITKKDVRNRDCFQSAKRECNHSCWQCITTRSARALLLDQFYSAPVPMLITRNVVALRTCTEQTRETNVCNCAI